MAENGFTSLSHVYKVGGDFGPEGITKADDVQGGVRSDIFSSLQEVNKKISIPDLQGKSYDEQIRMLRSVGYNTQKALKIREKIFVLYVHKEHVIGCYLTTHEHMQFIFRELYTIGK